MRGADPTAHLLLPGSARDAVTRYRDVVGGVLELHAFGEFGRTDGAADLIAHGQHWDRGDTWPTTSVRTLGSG